MVQDNKGVLNYQDPIIEILGRIRSIKEVIFNGDKFIELM